MIIETAGSFLVGRLEQPKLSETDRQALLALANEETEEELLDLLDEADIAFYGQFKELTDEQKETVRDMVRLMRKRNE